MTDPVTVQPTRDQLRALTDAATPGPWEFQHWGGQNQNGDYAESILFDGGGETMVYGVADRDGEFIAAARTALPRLLDQLDAAEQRIRDLTQEVRDERGAARDQMEQVRIRDARIKAVRDVLEAAYDDQVSFYDIRRALEG